MRSPAIVIPSSAIAACRCIEIDGAKRYVLDGQVFERLPGPGDVTLRPAPGAFLGYFVGKIKGTEFVERFDVEPSDRPEWYNRDARLKVMDGQGLDACWLFPSQGVVLEAPMLATGDIEASVATVQAFNRWLQEDWGFAYQNRIFAVPYMTLSDPDIAAAELKWAIDCGARIVNVRHGPAITRDGPKSPANIMFDRFWAIAEEAQITVAFHAGADYSMIQHDQCLARHCTARCPTDRTLRTRWATWSARSSRR